MYLTCVSATEASSEILIAEMYMGAEQNAPYQNKHKYPNEGFPKRDPWKYER